MFTEIFQKQNLNFFEKKRLKWANVAFIKVVGPFKVIVKIITTT
jgi:hypothetical protein